MKKLLYLILLSLSFFITMQGTFAEDYDYDVIVVGGEPEGVAAAVSAARNGAKTLLIEERKNLGGLFTYGHLNYLDLSMDQHKQWINQGIFKEWHDKIGAPIAFDVKEAEQAFSEMVEGEANLTLLMETTVKKAVKSGSALEAIKVKTPSGERTYTAKRFIDSTADADLAALAGVPYYLGQEDIGKRGQFMSATIVMLFENVDWDRVTKAAQLGVLEGAEQYKNVIWGFSGTIRQYKPVEEKTRLRGLNISRQKDGLVAINALQIFGVDPFDEKSIEVGLERGKRETYHILEFLQRELPGFEKATIAAFPEELYIRESRHIKAEYQLSIVDVWENRDQWDAIALGSYPVDVQASNKGEGELVVVNPVQYAIPFRSIVPLEVDRLLVASKASGYSSLAAGSARVVPTGVSVAEAAGTAAALSIEKNEEFRDLSKNKKFIEELQTVLKDQGALLYPFDLSYPYEGEWFYPALRELMVLGVVEASYDNDFNPDKQMSVNEFTKLIADSLSRSNQKEYDKFAKRVHEEVRDSKYDKKVTKRKAEKLISSIPKVGDKWNEIFKNEEYEVHFSQSPYITKAEGYYIIATLLNK
ncbi:hypothetical protein J2S74_004082 [Evansella vedderi]|uniref:Uncharacterized protein n=1 Tax=Evansella vedderi TaxID=38282 RepID=A0ABU0A2T6_9BACI|nr:FAD-dependent oxidoreductase [Evansella vedderi]MDQ0256660.1 hypothetical protein [Evansella vedderi]